MLKVTIDNEEVLCNKDFTINEEMLNTSSTILNNVYPVEWEEDKDYVSRFYYPKDYSKCKIFDEIYHPETKEEVEGTSFSIEVDKTKQEELLSIKGQTSQSGTPTPSTPQPINVVSGRQEVVVCGKNLWGGFTWEKTTSGITFSYSENGIVNVSGTSTATAQSMSLAEGQQHTITLDNGTYAISGGTADIFVQALDYDGNELAITNATTFTKTFTLTETKQVFLRYRVLSGKTLNTPFYPMLSKGSTIPPYEEYQGTDYEINLGKNLFSSDMELGTIDNTTGQNAGSNNGIRSIGYIKVQPNTTYTLSNTMNYNCLVHEYRGDKSYIQYDGNYASPRTFTTTANTYYIRVRSAGGQIQNDLNAKYQLELGNIPTTYSPYKTPIELCKIGDYQDRIFKNTIDNPYYDNALELDSWYIHKEIGRVVLNGSESWGYSNNIFYIASSLQKYIGTTITSTSNYFKGGYNKQNTTNYYNGNDDNSIGFSITALFIRDDSITSSSAFKTWLSTHNVEVYYVLNIPTNTLIEDEELINQLESIQLINGLNNVSVSSPYLPEIIKFLYNYAPAYTEEDLYFCGVVENTGSISLNPRYPHYCNLQILDFKTFLSEGETLDFVIYEKTIEEAIDQVISVIAPYGFIKGNINILHGDDVIGAYSTKDKTAYDVFNYIADITQSRWTTRMIDENTIAIDFYDPTLMPSGTAIEYNQNWFCNNKILDMSFNYSSRDYRNKQVMLSGEVYANISTTEIITADGYQTQFNTTDKIGYVQSILINGNPATIITKEEYDLGYEGDFIYQPGNPYFESDDLISTGAIITIVYYAVIEGREVVLNQSEISRINTMTGRKGVIARYENRNDATTTYELNQIGQSYLKYKGNPEITLKVQSLNNIWNIGERVEFSAPLTELTTEYMVKKKTINYIATQNNIFYTFELTSSFNSETDINYFDNQRAKTMGNIGIGEYISRNIDIENEANVIFYDLEVNEVQIDGDSTLQSTLQSPLGVE